MAGFDTTRSQSMSVFDFVFLTKLFISNKENNLKVPSYLTGNINLTTTHPPAQNESVKSFKGTESTSRKQSPLAVRVCPSLCFESVSLNCFLCQILLKDKKTKTVKHFSTCPYIQMSDILSLIIIYCSLRVTKQHDYYLTVQDVLYYYWQNLWSNAIWKYVKLSLLFSSTAGMPPCLLS